MPGLSGIQTLEQRGKGPDTNQFAALAKMEISIFTKIFILILV